MKDGSLMRNTMYMDRILKEVKYYACVLANFYLRNKLGLLKGKKVDYTPNLEVRIIERDRNNYSYIHAPLDCSIFHSMLLLSNCNTGDIIHNCCRYQNDK